jgi:hypothetical protein
VPGGDERSMRIVLGEGRGEGVRRSSCFSCFSYWRVDLVLLLVSYVRLCGTNTNAPRLDVAWLGFDPGAVRGVAGPAYV